MAEAQLQVFLEKVRQLNAFVALSEADPHLRQELRDCEHHDAVVALARRCGFEIGRRWGEPPPPEPPPLTGADPQDRALRPGAAAGEGAIPRHDPEGEEIHSPPLEKTPGPGSEAAGDDEGPAASPRQDASTAGSAEAAPTPGAAVRTEAGADPGAEPGPPGPVSGGEAAGAAVAARAQASGEDDRGRRTGGQAQPPGGDPVVSLWHAACPPPGEEVVQVLLETPTLRLERIHSCAAVSPEGFWYEQHEDEWVVLLQGSASLHFADERQERPLRTGDSLLIRAGRRHRVSRTDPVPGTVWLALFWRNS